MPPALPTGRATPPPRTHTFPNGAVATVRRMSQFTAASLEIALRKQYPPPEPPLVAGAHGDMEPNEADPTYERELAAWQQQQQFRLIDALLEYAIDIEVDQDALGLVRGFFDRLGLPFDEVSDTVAYIKHCCIEDIERDLTPLADLIRGTLAPTEADVQAHVATFSGDVGGAQRDDDAHAAVEGPVQPAL